ncbi:MAG: hypothetical protein AB8B56_01080 [Crocinitomicaceae bacterium]
MRLLKFSLLLLILVGCSPQFTVEGRWKMTAICILGEECANFGSDDLPFTLHFDANNEFDAGNSVEIWEKGTWEEAGDELTINLPIGSLKSGDHPMAHLIDQIDFNDKFHIDISDDSLIVLWNESGTFILKRL